MFEFKPWELSATGWLPHIGVHEPHLAEISPAQVGMMSAHQRRAYEARRAREWAASSAAKQEWRQAVVDAYAAGVPLTDMHEAARSIVADQIARRVLADREAAAQPKFVKVRFEDVKVGDVLDHQPGGRGTVLKKNRVTLKVRLESASITVTWRGEEFARPEDR